MVLRGEGVDNPMHIMVYTEKSEIPKQRGPFYINFPFYISFYLPIFRN